MPIPLGAQSHLCSTSSVAGVAALPFELAVRAELSPRGAPEFARAVSQYLRGFLCSLIRSFRIPSQRRSVGVDPLIGKSADSVVSRMYLWDAGMPPSPRNSMRLLRRMYRTRELWSAK